MISVTNSAEECNRILPAKDDNNNLAASAESISKRSVSDRSGKEKKHSFSNTLARKKNEKGERLGWNASIILKYLSNILRKHGRNFSDGRWVRVNLDHISSQYSYMGRTTVDENIQRLIQFGLCHAKNLNAEAGRPGYDRTRWYHVPQKWMNISEEDPRYFDTAFAAKHGVPAAVIHQNFCHWIDVCQKKQLDVRVLLKPEYLGEILPFNKSTIKRAIRTLIRYEYIKPVTGKCCWYAMGLASGSKADEGGSKADKGRSNPDESGSKADNDSVSNNWNVLEKNSKGNPAGFDFSSSVTNTISPLDYLPDAGNEHNADGQQSEYSQHEEIVPVPRASSIDIPPSVSNVNGLWPNIDSYEQLQQINRSNRHIVADIEKCWKSLDKLKDTTLLIARKSLSQLDAETVDGLYNNPDPDTLVTTLLSYHQQVCDASSLDPDGLLFPVLYYAAFECLIGAFILAGDMEYYPHSIEVLGPISYKLHLKLWERAEDLRVKEEDLAFTDLREKHASLDEDKEYEASLTPAEKARVFRNALDSRNKVGWIFWNRSYETGIINISKSGLKLVQQLFEHNELATPADIISIMDRCLDAYVNEPAPREYQPNTNWNSRTGATDVLIFAKRLKAIVEELNTPECPFKNFLGDIHREQQEAQELLAA